MSAMKQYLDTHPEAEDKAFAFFHAAANAIKQPPVRIKPQAPTPGKKS